MSPSDAPFWDAVDAIRERDPRFRREAYGFVMAALGVTVQSLPAGRLEDAQRRHLSGQELLGGVVALAQREFGAMAPLVFQEWGVQSSEDVGAIVFALVRSGQLSARSEDRPEDFSGGIHLMSALGEAGGVSPPDRTRSKRRPAGGPPPGGEA